MSDGAPADEQGLSTNTRNGKKRPAFAAGLPIEMDVVIYSGTYSGLYTTAGNTDRGGF